MPVEALKTGTSDFEFTCVFCRKAKREYLGNKSLARKQ